MSLLDFGKSNYCGHVSRQCGSYRKKDKWCHKSRVSKVVLGMRNHSLYGLVWYLGPVCLHVNWIHRNSWSNGLQQWLLKRLGMLDIRWRYRCSPHFPRIWITRVLDGYLFSASPWFISIKGEIIWCYFWNFTYVSLFLDIFRYRSPTILAHSITWNKQAQKYGLGIPNACQPSSTNSMFEIQNYRKKTPLHPVNWLKRSLEFPVF